MPESQHKSANKSQTTYTGICINGKMVQVEDSFGHVNELPINEYEKRQIQPPIEFLPICKGV